MTAALRHRCRNPHCRMKLPALTGNEHHAFCTPGCHSHFYHSRCLVCEDPMRRRRKAQRIKSGHKRCEAEYRRFPHAFAYPLSRPQISDECSRSADKTGTKFGIKGHPPTHRCLREWWWGDPGIGDLSLYDKDGLTLARLVLEDGRYHLRSPVTWPRMAWPDLDEARHRAEHLALAAIPLASVDPKLAARIKRDNVTPHPMGAPLNRLWPARTADASLSVWKPSGSGIAPEIPDFLRRTPCGPAGSASP